VSIDETNRPQHLPKAENSTNSPHAKAKVHSARMLDKYATVASKLSIKRHQQDT